MTHLSQVLFTQIIVFMNRGKSLKYQSVYRHKHKLDSQFCIRNYWDQKKQVFWKNNEYFLVAVQINGGKTRDNGNNGILKYNGRSFLQTQPLFIGSVVLQFYYRDLYSRKNYVSGVNLKLYLLGILHTGLTLQADGMKHIPNGN